jgi:uncharacterized protein YecT (DUF1311 family)
LLAAGAGAAIVLGVGAGLLVRPNIDNTDAAGAKGPAVPIEVTRPPPEPVPAGKLQVLPPGAEAAARAAPVETYPAPAQQVEVPGPPPPLPRVEGSVPAPFARYPSLAPPPAVRAGPLSAPPPGRVADACAAGSPAEQMVCADPRLAAADRDLDRAYRRAMAAGVSPQMLRSEQRDWLAIREDAARRSPRAVANIYAQRIDELNAMADDARERGGGEDEGPGD